MRPYIACKQRGTMFLDLPRDLQEKVADCLDVHDRTRLNCALPKAEQGCKRPKDKALGIMYHAIKKKYVKHVSLYMKQFLNDLPPGDVTVDEIARLIPTFKPSKKTSQKTDLLEDKKADLLDKLIAGTATEDDLVGFGKYIEALGNTCELWTALATATPKMYDLLFDSPHTKGVVQQVSVPCLIFRYAMNNIEHQNVELAAHILNRHPELGDAIRSHDTAGNIMVVGPTRSVKLLFSIVPDIPKDVVEAAYAKAVEYNITSNAEAILRYGLKKN